MWLLPSSERLRDGQAVGELDERFHATYQEHARILRAVLQRKVDQAKMLLRAHVEQSKAEVRSITLNALHQAQRRRTA